MSSRIGRTRHLREGSALTVQTWSRPNGQRRGAIELVGGQRNEQGCGDNPISVATDALRGLLLGGPVLTPVLKTIAWTVALAVVFGTLAIRQHYRLA